jgi:hypothetical protein
VAVLLPAWQGEGFDPIAEQVCMPPDPAPKRIEFRAGCSNIANIVRAFSLLFFEFG